MDITTELVRGLIDSQFPQWQDLPVRTVEKSGHDNRTFRLGDEMSVRLPSHERYAAAVAKEMHWLPILQPQLSLPIPSPVAEGKPTAAYPLPWSINRWLEGETISATNVLDRSRLAVDLAAVLQELQAIDASGGMPAGTHNFHRGGDLAVYEGDTRSVLERLDSGHDPRLLAEIWELALSSSYSAAPVWVHGDVAVGNLLVQGGRLSGVIDFGTMGTGDPASDLVMAWTYFDPASRVVFLDRIGAQPDMVDRARGWALWKALISYDWNERGSELSEWGRSVIDAIIEEWSAAQ
ncbi:aminoglycoside phosphotransferase family protein [Paenibacillus sp. 1P07SE]|uniref:aminoglycoside phosphotransferase family protein n=1 Tax=Paenibacillus sp. 1P07SE TaxID=3132209 RepID=UPI0039A6200C